jgi:hypothetical protein
MDFQIPFEARDVAAHMVGKPRVNRSESAKVYSPYGDSKGA